MNKRRTRVLLMGVAWVAVCLATSFALVFSVKGDLRSERDHFVSGSEVARDVMAECERGDEPCDAALRKANERLRPMGLRIFEDGSVVRER